MPDPQSTEKKGGDDDYIRRLKNKEVLFNLSPKMASELLREKHLGMDLAKAIASGYTGLIIDILNKRREVVNVTPQPLQGKIQSCRYLWTGESTFSFFVQMYKSDNDSNQHGIFWTNTSHYTEGAKVNKEVIRDSWALPEIGPIAFPPLMFDYKTCLILSYDVQQEAYRVTSWGINLNTGNAPNHFRYMEEAFTFLKETLFSMEDDRRMANYNRMLLNEYIPLCEALRRWRPFEYTNSLCGWQKFESASSISYNKVRNRFHLLLGNIYMTDIPTSA